MTTLTVILAAAAFLTGLGVLALLILVLASIRTEERHMSLTSTPPTRAGAMSRRMLGVYVRRPHAAPHCHYQQGRR